MKPTPPRRPFYLRIRDWEQSLEPLVPVLVGLAIPTFAVPALLLWRVGDVHWETYGQALKFPTFALGAWLGLAILLRGIWPQRDEPALSIAARFSVGWILMLALSRGFFEGPGRVSFGFDEFLNYSWWWSQPIALGIMLFSALLSVTIITWLYNRPTE